ncbi:hypothetical protein Tco_1313506 [Tanacetum coccineum]
MGASHTLEATLVEFYSDEDEPEVDLGNITNSYTVPTTPNTRIHKDHPIENVIGDIEPTSIAKALDYVSEWCYDYAKQFVEQQLVPFYDHFKKHIQAANDTLFKEVKEYEQIFDDLDAEYERCILDYKNLTIEKKNLLIKNDCLIAECLEKDICSIVLSSDIVVPPSSNCLCEELRSACDREHTKVLELEAEVLKQQKMVIESEKPWRPTGKDNGKPIVEPKELTPSVSSSSKVKRTSVADYIAEKIDTTTA